MNFFWNQDKKFPQNSQSLDRVTQYNSASKQGWFGQFLTLCSFEGGKYSRPFFGLKEDDRYLQVKKTQKSQNSKQIILQSPFLDNAFSIKMTINAHHGWVIGHGPTLKPRQFPLLVYHFFLIVTKLYSHESKSTSSFLKVLPNKKIDG